MKIKIIVTGGTFDKEYNELTGELFFNSTHVPEMLKLGRSRVEVDIVTLMMRDSLHMTDEDIENILKECNDCKEKHIIITHGTDNMVKTANVLGRFIKDKTIVFTGAIIPYAFGSSDGLFNLGSALAFVQCLRYGVYIVMNGKYFTYDDVRKNKQNGIFEEINNNNYLSEVKDRVD